MNRAIRFLRHAGIAGSALVCVAAVADRVWDHWAGHYINATAKWQIGERIVVSGPTIRSNEGVILVGLDRMESTIAAVKRPASSGLLYGTESRDAHWSLGVVSSLRRSGFAFNTTGAEDLGFYPYRVRSIEAPHWFIVTLTAIAPALWLTGHLRRRRDRGGTRCRRCGYDLRATPDRCPECGEPRGASGSAEGERQ